MLIYPAIDLMGGKCVRLAQGNFACATEYSDDPSQMIDRFAEAGAEWAHVVDLDGARADRPAQYEVIGAIAERTSLKIQAAGGVRTAEDVERLLSAGVARVIIGTIAVKEPARARAWLDRYGPARIGIFLDLRCRAEAAPIVMTNAWRHASPRTLWEMLDEYQQYGFTEFGVTAIDRDGMLSGPDLDLIGEVVARYPRINLQASGGVGSLADIASLKCAGASAAVVGKALYERRFTLRDAVDAGA